MNPENDPVVLRRNRIDHYNKIASRSGYGMWGISMVTFFVGLGSFFTESMHFVSGVTLIIGSIILAPSIVVKYGIRAARREDAAAAAAATTATPSAPSNGETSS